MARRETPSAVLLARLPLFQALDAVTLGRLAAATARHMFERGDQVFRRGEPVEGMYVVVYGDVKLWGRTPKGGRRLTGMVGPGQCFGEPIMFLEQAAVVTAEAASDTLLLQISRAAVFEELDRTPQFARAMIIGLSQRVESLVRELERQALTNGTERFIAYLLHRCNDASVPFETTLPAAKGAIASQLNLTPEHFSRILQDLQQAGLLQVIGRKISVPKPDRLVGAWSRL